MKGNSSIIDRLLFYTLVPSFFIALYLVFIWSPVEKFMGVAQKIFYFHVGSAWVAFLAFIVVGYYSVRTLIKPKIEHFINAGISAEIGVLFTTITLITGMTWEIKLEYVVDMETLATTLILWFIYVAYLFVRKMEGSWEKIAKLSAVFGIIGVINVPVVFMAIRWWNTKLHPVVFGDGKNQDGGGIAPDMLVALLFSIFTITVLYAFLMRKGIEIEKMRHVVKKAKNMAMEKLAG